MEATCGDIPASGSRAGAAPPGPALAAYGLLAGPAVPAGIWRKPQFPQKASPPLTLLPHWVQKGISVSHYVTLPRFVRASTAPPGILRVPNVIGNPPSLAAFFDAWRHNKGTFLRFEGDRGLVQTSYAETALGATRFAQRLRAAGIGKGERVLL